MIDIVVRTEVPYIQLNYSVHVYHTTFNYKTF